MFAWLVDHAGVLYFLLGLAALGLAAGWWMTRRPHFLWAGASLAALALIIWLLSVFSVTEQQRLERIVEDIARGVREGDIDRIFKHMSKSFRRANNRTMNVTELRELAKQHLPQAKLGNFHHSRFAALDIDRGKGVAKVEFFIHGEGEFANAPVRCVAEFVFEDGDWRMREFDLFIGNTGQRYPFP